jgi:peptidoglycan/xylan/chitin deacetylase (PgdA/CDA1 family)
MVGLKKTVLSVAAAGGAFSFFRWLTQHQARVLAYHGVDANNDPLLNFDGFHVRPDMFERHLRTLRGHYKVVTLRSLAECFRDNRPPPPRAVAITFDDGYANNLHVAARLLGEYVMPATFFVTTGFVDGTHRPWWFVLRDAIKRTHETECTVESEGTQRKFKLLTSGDRRSAIVQLERILKSLPAATRGEQVAMLLKSLNVPDAAPAYPMLNWTEVRELQASGHEVGAHTVSHVSMGHEQPEVVAAEVKASIARIAEKTGIAPVLYSYPYGEATHFTSEVAQIVRDAGCIGGVTTIEGFNGRGTNPFLMKRVNVTGNHDRNAFRALVSGMTMAVRR